MIAPMSLPLVIHATTSARTRDRDSALPAMSEEEFRAFYERTARPLWAYLVRVTGDRQQADDVLQEAYYRFFRAAARHQSESHRRNSLFRIATNIVRDAARRAGRRPSVPLGGDASVAALPETSGPAPDRRAALRTDLARAMERLEPRERRMLWLAYAQGASHREISEVLGLRAVSVRTMLLRARRKLAAILAEGGRASRPEARP